MDLHGLSILRLNVDWMAGVLSIDIGLGDGEVAIRSSGLRRLEASSIEIPERLQRTP